MNRPVFSVIATVLISAGLALALPSSASAQEEQPTDQLQAPQPATVTGRIARLSFTQGDVQFQNPGDDWQSASINLPLQQGFRLATTEGRAEIQFESGMIVRLAENSILEFTELDNAPNSGRITKLDLTQGTIIVTADLRPTDSFSVDAPNVHATAQEPTRFRIDTTQGDSWVGIFAGNVSVKSATGETKVTKGHTFHISGQDVAQVSIDMNAPLDDFDQWAADRDRTLQQGYGDAAQYVANYAPDYSEYNYGLSDLSSYGHWVVVAGSGLCWEPYGVPEHWRPFFFGRWQFFGRTGWTWISSEPWGWLPFHTGRWFSRPGGGWMWQPGPIRAWNPAPVHWFNVGNQLGWVPAGTLNSHGLPPASGIVVGTREPRGLRVTPGVRAPLASELSEKITRTNAPVVQRSEIQRSEFHAGATPVIAPPTRPKNFPADSSIRFDPATRTFMNAYPNRTPNPPDSSDNSAADGSAPIGGGSASPHRQTPVRPSNTIQRPAYNPVTAQPQHTAPPTHSAPSAPAHTAPPPPPAHSSPPPAHPSGGGVHH
jgi:hypothetical protein